MLLCYFGVKNTDEEIPEDGVTSRCCGFRYCVEPDDEDSMNWKGNFSGHTVIHFTYSPLLLL
jgi:hypothetical protein